MFTQHVIHSDHVIITWNPLVISFPKAAGVLFWPHALYLRTCRTPASSYEPLDVASSPDEAKAWLASPDAQESWTSCATLLEDLGLTSEVSDKLLAKGFAWTSRAYWGLEKVRLSVRSRL